MRITLIIITLISIFTVKNAPFFVGKNNQSHKWRAVINGDEVWYPCYRGPDRSRVLSDVILDKRNINDSEKSLQFIDVEYLGTLSIPQSIIYDEPYIWIMAERDDQIQMLKLLPNK